MGTFRVLNLWGGAMIMRVNGLQRIYLVACGILLVNYFSCAAAMLGERRPQNSVSLPVQVSPEISLAVIDEMCEIIALNHSCREDASKSILDTVVDFITTISNDAIRRYFASHPSVCLVGVSEEEVTAFRKLFMAIFIAKITFDNPKEGGAKTPKQCALRAALIRTYTEKVGRAKENTSSGMVHDFLKRRTAQ
jgi:hypothetical protein